MEYKKIPGKWRYQVTIGDWIPTRIFGQAFEREFFSLSPAGSLFVLSDYTWNGATGCKDTKNVMPASAFHDALYQAIKKGYLDPKRKRENRLLADQMLKRKCLADGMSKFRAEYIYRTVRAFGWMWV